MSQPAKQECVLFLAPQKHSANAKFKSAGFAGPKGLVGTEPHLPTCSLLFRSHQLFRELYVPLNLSSAFPCRVESSGQPQNHLPPPRGPGSHWLV